MEHEGKFDIHLNIDYEGSLVDEQTNKSKPVLTLRVCLKKDLEYNKIMGINITSGYFQVLEDAIKDLSKRVKRWTTDYGKTIDLESFLLTHDELKRKFNNWMSLNPQILEAERTLDVII